MDPPEEKSVQSALSFDAGLEAVTVFKPGNTFGEVLRIALSNRQNRPIINRLPIECPDYRVFRMSD